MSQRTIQERFGEDMLETRLVRSRRHAARALLSLISLVALLASSGCGLLSGSEGEGSGKNGLEQSKISVGVMPIVDTAAFHYALDNGYFEKEGLEVEPRTIQGGADGIPLLANGELDITWGNWVSYFQAQQKGAVDLSLLTDGYRAKKGMFLTMAAPGKGISKPEDLKGKKIAVNTTKNVVELSTLAALKPYGVTKNDVEFVELPFPDMPAALQRGDVDAATMLDPFITKSEEIGAKQVLDVATADATEVPIAGFAASKEFTEQNPKTAQAFQRAMSRAQADVAADGSKAKQVVPSYAKVDQKTAQKIRLGTFPDKLEPKRLETIVRLMREHGLLKGDFDVEPLIYKPGK